MVFSLKSNEKRQQEEGWDVQCVHMQSNYEPVKISSRKLILSAFKHTHTKLYASVYRSLTLCVCVWCTIAHLQGDFCHSTIFLCFFFSFFLVFFFWLKIIKRLSVPSFTTSFIQSIDFVCVRAPLGSLALWFLSNPHKNNSIKRSKPNNQPTTDLNRNFNVFIFRCCCCWCALDFLNGFLLITLIALAHSVDVTQKSKSHIGHNAYVVRAPVMC